MTVNAVWANDVAYGLLNEYFSFTASALIGKFRNVIMPLMLTSTITTILDFPTSIMQIHG